MKTKTHILSWGIGAVILLIFFLFYTPQTTQEPWEAAVRQMEQEELQDIGDEAEGKRLAISRWEEKRKQQIMQNVDEQIRVRKAKEAAEEVEYDNPDLEPGDR